MLALTLLCAASAYVASQFLPRTYASEARVVVGQSLSSANPGVQQLQVAQRLTETYATLAQTRPVLERVIARVGLPWSTDELEDVVSVRTLQEVNVIVITAASDNPDVAAAIANGLAEELIAASPAIQGQQRDLEDFLRRDLAAAQNQIETMQAQLDSLAALPDRTPEQEAQLQTLQNRLVGAREVFGRLLDQLANASSNRLTVIDPAVPAARPASPNVLLNTLLGGAIGLLVALALAFLIDYLDDTVKTAEEIAQVTGLPTLGFVSQFRGESAKLALYRLVALMFPRSQSAESFRSLRTNIEFASIDAPLGVILVTSAVPAEGKTTIAANLAIVLAQTGKRVLLLDGDLRKPGVHDLFNLPNDFGLTNVIRKTGALGIHQTEVDGLSVLPTGPLPPNPAELIGSDRMKSTLLALREKHDVIVIDSPPLVAVTDAALLARLSDATLLVVRARRTRSEALRRGWDALSKVHAPVIGAVLNGLPRTNDEMYYGYYPQPKRLPPDAELWSTNKTLRRFRSADDQPAARA